MYTDVPDGRFWGRREQNSIIRRRAFSCIFNAYFLSLLVGTGAIAVLFYNLLYIKPLKIARNCFYDKIFILLNQENDLLIESGERVSGKTGRCYFLSVVPICDDLLFSKLEMVT